MEWVDVGSKRTNAANQIVELVQSPLWLLLVPATAGLFDLEVQITLNTPQGKLAPKNKASLGCTRFGLKGTV